MLITFAVFLLCNAIKLGISTEGVVFYSTHSHNDYNRKVPLWDAVSKGIGSVEVDVHLVDDALQIGHILPGKETLSGLYLDPIRDKIEKDGYLWDWNSTQPLNVFLDVKTDAKTTYLAIYKLIDENYSDLFSYFDDNQVYHQQYLHCIITGSRSSSTMEKQTGKKYCSMDSMSYENVGVLPTTFSPITSLAFIDNFGLRLFLSDEQVEELKEMVGGCHKYNRRLRIYTAPQNRIFRQQLVEADDNRQVIVYQSSFLNRLYDFGVDNGYTNENQNCENTPQWCAPPS